MLQKPSLHAFLFFLLWITPSIGLAQYQMNGNTIQTACNCYQLTSANDYQNGSVWNVNLFDLSNPFDFTFDVFLGCNNGGADGMAFVLQALSVNAGSPGGGMGYAGINPSLAVEMDTYQNGSSADPNYDHIALQANGSTTHSGANNLAGPVPTSASNNNVEDCAWHVLNVSWNPATQTFTVYFDGVLRLTYVGDIINNIFGGDPNVYWGLTGATGGSTNQHQFCNALDPAFILTSPVQCEGFPVDFESASTVATGQITDFQWDFGDNTTGSGGQVSHTYAAPGTYTVTLTISSEGCTESNSTQVTINPSPDASLGTDLAFCDGGSVQIGPANSTAGGIFQWTPATGLNDATIESPNAAPAATTNYTFTVVDGNGCSGSDDITVSVNPLPVANAGIDQTICNGDITTMAASGGVQYAWNPTTDLVDGASATTQASPTATINYTLTVTDANNCVDTDNMTITVNPLPVVDAGADDSMCDGATVQLGASGAVNYDWTPTTGLSNSAIANPVFDGSATTIFTVTGTNASGCEDSDDVTVTVFPQPTAGFTNPVDVCLGNASVFVDNSIGNGLVYAWDLGDNSAINTDPAPTYPYGTDGTFNINLLVTDINGCQATASGMATVFPLPTAAMNIVSGESYCENEVIKFVDMSTGGIVDVFWNFGDNAFVPAFPNTTSSLSNPEFAYPNFVFSPFTVTLSVTNAAGCFEQTTTQIIINDNPIADFTFNTVCEGLATDLLDASTVLGNSNIADWKWNLGDASAIVTTQNPSYTYAQDGIYSVQLIAETNWGCSDTSIQDVWVNPTPVVELEGTDICLEEETIFTNNSSPQDNTIISWDWNFGDANTETGANVSHTYLDHGLFTVSLTATSDSGCVADNTTDVLVFPNPEPDFSVVEHEGCTPHEVLFVNNSSIATGQITEYHWNLGEGDTLTDSSPAHTYQDSGYYDVFLSTTSNQGCYTELLVSNAVRANITPIADFSVNKELFSLLDANLIVTDASQHTLTYDWDFGDFSYATNQNPTHQYDEPGIYTINLMVTNGECQDLHEATVEVEPHFSFYIPSSFTPNDDNKNDLFFGQGESFNSYTMRVFNRWGELIFESNDKEFGWDGTYKGMPVESGVYVYSAFVVDWKDVEHTYTGKVILLR